MKIPQYVKTIRYEQYLKIEQRMLNETEEIYTYNIDNEHDKLFKDLLSDKEEARKFINKFLKLPEPLKKNELELYNSSYITSEYKSKEADIVYKKQNEDIFFLIEHQSTIDKKKVRQVDYEYPLVIAIVLYTGNKKWNAKLRFEDMQKKLPRI